jgi:Viral BACON domain
LNFAAPIGGGNPANQTLDISNLGIGTVDWTASEDAPWLSISPTNGAAPSTLTAAVDISGLSVGSYTGTITISSAQASNSPITVPVALTVLPVFAVNPSKLNFIATTGAASPPRQTVNISNNDSAPFPRPRADRSTSRSTTQSL